MRVTEAYFQENNMKKNRPTSDDFYADYFDIEIKEKTVNELNRDKGVFKTKTFEGINTEKSVFEKTAIFHTEQK